MSRGNRYRICGPLFLEYCFVCHCLKADQREAGLRLGLGWFWFFLSWKVFVWMPDLSAVPTICSDHSPPRCTATGCAPHLSPVDAEVVVDNNVPQSFDVGPGNLRVLVPHRG